MPKLLPNIWNVPEIFRARLGARAGRQRAMLHEGHLLLVVHGLPGADEVTRSASFFWRAPDGTWKGTGGAAKGGVGALRAHVETFTSAGHFLEERLEKASTASEYFAVLQHVAPALRAARNLHKALQDAREGCPDDKELITIRDQAYEAERTLDLVQIDAKGGLDFVTARRAEQQAKLSEQINRSSHRLNLLVAFFLPISALAGVLGINLEHGFERSHAPWLYVAVVAGAVVFGLLVRAGVSGGGKVDVD